MSVFSKILESLGKTISKELDKNARTNASKNLAKPSNNPHKQIHKEQRGIYNVTYNGKNASLIRQDLDSIDSAILYEKGRENPKNHKGYGARHIFKHTKNDKELGYISQDELLNLGQNLRNYLAKHKEPFIDKNGARIYEWEKEGVRFRAVVGSTSKAGKDPATMAESKDLSLPTQRIITFYSDRNAKNKMEFKNPALNPSKKQDFSKDSTLESTTLIDDKLPPMMRE